MGLDVGLDPARRLASPKTNFNNDFPESHLKQAEISFNCQKILKYHCKFYKTQKNTRKFSRNSGDNSQTLLIAFEWFYTLKFDLKLKTFACTLTNKPKIHR